MKNNLESRISNITFAFIALVMVGSVIFLTLDSSNESKPSQETVEVIELQSKPIQASIIEVEKPIVKISKKTFQNFIDDMGFRESSNVYDTINKYGYKGRYQFGKMALKDLKIHNRVDFLDNKELQDKAFISLVMINKYRLRNEIKKYNNTVHNGVTITESGLLGASHLVGSKAVKKYLKHGILAKDANGVTVENYLKHFNGYEITVEAKRKINLKDFAKTK